MVAIMSASRRCLWLVLLAAVVCSIPACRSDPAAEARAFIASGDKYVAAGKLPEAVIEYRNAVDRQPQLADAYYRLGRTYDSLKEEQKATAAFAKLVELDATHPDVDLRIARALI